MSTKTKAAGVGIFAIIVGLAAIGLKHMFDRGGGLGLGVMGPTSTSTSKGSGINESGTLILIVAGEQYMVDGGPRSFDDVVSAAAERSQSQADQTGTHVLLKKKGSARYNTVLKLEEELKRRGIRYRSENDF